MFLLQKQTPKILKIIYNLFVVFSDTYIQKARKSYMDSRARKNLNNINTELQDVHRIMVQNIDDVLQRGEKLSGLYGFACCNTMNKCTSTFMERISFIIKI